MIGLKQRKIIMTELKYLKDTYLLESNATIQELGSDEKGNYVILDSTIFYPQGGGQPTDYGVIEKNTSEFSVTFVAFVDGDVRHYGECAKGELKPGDEVELRLDIDRRKRNAKNHSAGHFIGFIVESIHPNLRATKGYHFDDGPYVEFVGELSLDDKEKLTEQINSKIAEVISESQAVETFEVSYDELQEHCKYVPDYIPSGKPIRVMKTSMDAYPCGGTHVKNTSELGNVSVRKIKQKGDTIKVSYVVA